MAAVHFQNLLFLLFIAIAFFFQLLTKAATKSNKESSRPKPKSPNTPPPVPRVRPETDEERVRKFLEALGQPPGSAPPPPVKSRPTYQKPVVLPHVGPGRSPLPPLTTRPSESEPDWRSEPERLPREQKVFVPKPPSPIFETPIEPAPATASPLAPTIASPIALPAQVVRQPDKIDISSLLRSGAGLREAIILREIFGPPRSMQPLELIAAE